MQQSGIEPKTSGLVQTSREDYKFVVAPYQ